MLREPRYNPQDNRLIRPKKSSHSPLLCVLSPKPERSQNASTRRVRAVSSHSETAFQQTSNGARTASRQSDALSRNRANTAHRQRKSNPPRHSASTLGQSHLAKGIYSQKEVSGNHSSSRGGLGRASNAGAKAMSNHKKVASPNKVAIACIALLAVLAICGVDGLINGNKFTKVL